MKKRTNRYAAYLKRAAKFMVFIILLNNVIGHLPLLKADAVEHNGSLFVNEMELKDESGSGGVSGNGLSGNEGNVSETESAQETESVYAEETEAEEESRVSGNEGAESGLSGNDLMPSLMPLLTGGGGLAKQRENPILM